jgi:ABC-type branched-subunit amino acid transport system substrate-binding protein
MVHHRDNILVRELGAAAYLARITTLIMALVAAFNATASAQVRYSQGASDTEIKIGNTMPYSGPASAYGVIGRTAAAYFKKVNDEGGVRARKINFISYDDAYSPPKTVEQARKLVESDEVLLIFGSLGTPTSRAIQKYMNNKKVPQLFVGSGATKWNDPQSFPWTMGWQPSYRSEAHIYAKFLLKTKPDAKIAVFYQNDDYGKDLLKSLKEGLGPKAATVIVAEESYETSEPTIDSHIVKLKATGADVFMNFSTPKFAAQAIKKLAEIGWKTTHIVSGVSSSVGTVMKPAGFDAAQGIISANYLKDVSDPKWKEDPGMTQFLKFMARYFPEGDTLDNMTVAGYGIAQTMVRVLELCGDDLTRENVMKQAASIRDFRTEVLLPGIRINTGPNDFAPISSLQLMAFKGERWELFGEVFGGEAD